MIDSYILFGVLMLGIMLACQGPDAVGEDWFVPPRLDSATLASGEGYALDSPQAVFFAASHVAPGLDDRWPHPATQLPLFLWEDVLLGENIADLGSCPYLVADGPETSWRTNCRSQEGFNWSGGVTRVTWSEESGDWTHYAFDVVVETELEDRAVQRVALTGEFYYADGDDAPLVRHAEANLHIEASGYWARDFEEELEAAWSDLALTGTWETLSVDGVRSARVDALAELGGQGFAARAEGLVEGSGCVAEPQGSVWLSSGVEAELRFEGAARCDGCAELYLDGVRSTNACRGW